MNSLITNAENGEFVLKDIVYKVTNALIYAEFQDMEIILSIDTVAEKDDDKIEYELSRVRLYHEDGFNTHTSTFKELKGKKFHLELDPDSDEAAAGTLYVLEHEDITKCVIEILNITDNKITVHWSGSANVYANEEYSENVPFDTVFTADILKS